ncbi:hypothetical protein ACN28S_38415 [Cystobacter fuscus]
MTDQPTLSFFARLWLALVCFWRIWLDRSFAQAVLPVREADRAGKLPAGRPVPEPTPTKPTPPPAAPPPSGSTPRRSSSWPCSSAKAASSTSSRRT